MEGVVGGVVVMVARRAKGGRKGGKEGKREGRDATERGGGGASMW